MHAQIKHKVNTTIFTYNVYVILLEQNSTSDTKERLEFDKEANLIRAFKNKEVLQATAYDVYLYTPYTYTFKHLTLRTHPALDIQKLKTDVRYHRLKELTQWLLVNKAFLTFGIITAFDYVDVVIDSIEHTITIQTLENDEVLYDYS